MSLTLLILAAGMGSRYGGLKQIDPVGPHGETLLDYSIADALAAGFDRVVFVIRRDFEALFREKIGAKYEGRMRVDYVFQSLDRLPHGYSVPAGREKPWGTGHATWCAKGAIHEPFAVINADDFYGRDSFRQLAEFLRQGEPRQAALAGFTLRRTLSENGLVSRGLCQVVEGWLHRVEERTGISATDVGPGRELTGDETVSMNCWAFEPEFLIALDSEWRRFLAAVPEGDVKAEFYLPGAVSNLIQDGALTARVLPTSSDWFGVTYREDRPRVEAAIRALVDRGDYASPLFPA